MTMQDLVSTRSAFTLSYDGQGVNDNSIDAVDLTGSLLALNTLVARSNQIMNGRNASASLRVNALNSGSFEVELLILVAVSAVQLLSTDFVTVASNLKVLLTGGANVLGVLGAFKRLRGRPIDSSEQLQDAIRISARDLRVDLPLRAFEVFQDNEIRRALHSICKPLERDGITKITFKDELGELVSLEPSDVDFGEGSEDQRSDQNIIDIPRQNLTVVAPNLEDPHAKWRLGSGGRTPNWYTILDEVFLNRVVQGAARFGSGDVLVAQVRIRQSVSSEGKIASEYEVVRVIEHHGREEQLAML